MIPDEVKAASERLTGMGERHVVVATTDSELPFAIFSIPTLGQLSQYVAQAGDANCGPLLAAVGLARITGRFPAGDVIEGMVRARPFVVMRAVQVLLRELGLSARAEKKSL